MTTLQKASIFAVVLIILFIGSLITSITNVGPIVLGTEMNTNGQVEYLCLGRGCELNNIMPAGGK